MGTAEDRSDSAQGDDDSESGLVVIVQGCTSGGIALMALDDGSTYIVPRDELPPEALELVD